MENGIIRVGLIGAGANTRLRHIPGFREQEGVEIVAVANRSRESGEAIASEYEIPTVYDNWLELMESDDIDAVLCGDLALHAPDISPICSGKRQTRSYRISHVYGRRGGP